MTVALAFLTLPGVIVLAAPAGTALADVCASAGLLAAGEGSQQYGFRIEHQGQVIAKGRAAVMLRD